MPETTRRTDLDLAAFKTQLLELKASVEATKSSMSDQDEDGLNTTGNDRSDNKMSDLGTELQIRTQDAALLENEQVTLDAVERALARIADGTFGFSEQSGKPISRERLEAIPYATLTLEEAEAGEQ